MSQYSKLIVTKQGQTLLSRVLAGSGDKLRFTKICISATAYDLSEVEGLTELSDIRQQSEVSHLEETNESAVSVEATFTNENLAEGYYIRSIGLYADDGNGGDVLYAVTVENSGNCYIPAFAGSTVSGAVVRLTVAVGNAESISIETNSSAVASVMDIRRLESALAEHNSSAEAHLSIGKTISRLDSRVSLLELKYTTNVSGNPFEVTFENLDGASASGVWNDAMARIEF